jgi:glycosyltransferase involved in cell wall biosynthesis
MNKVAVLMSSARYNDEWLLDAVKSVLNENSDDLIVHVYIFFDGCKSIYGTSAACDVFQSKIFADSSPQLRGMAYGLNRCIANVLKSGIWYDYIARMDDDDLIIAGKFQKQINFLKTNPFDFCSTRMLFIDECYNESEPTAYGAFDNKLPALTTFLSSDKATNHIIHAACMFKSWMLYELLLTYNPLIKKGSEYEVWLRLLSYGVRYGLLDEVLYKYRCHENQLSIIKNETSAFLNMREDIFKFYKNNQEYFLHY